MDTLYIADDGTLDTVVACTGCDWEGRYNPEPGEDIQEGEEWDRCEQALEMAGEDHESCVKVCPECDAGDPTSLFPYHEVCPNA